MVLRPGRCNDYLFCGGQLFRRSWWNMMKHDETVAATSLKMLNRSWSVLGSEQSYGRNKSLWSWHICMALSLSWTFGMAMERAREREGERERERHICIEYWRILSLKCPSRVRGWSKCRVHRGHRVHNMRHTACEDTRVSPFPQGGAPTWWRSSSFGHSAKNPRNPNHLAKENVK